jgi:hypothetical protein
MKLPRLWFRKDLEEAWMALNKRIIQNKAFQVAGFKLPKKDR